MSADLTNKITDSRNGARPVSTTVSSSRSTGATTLACTSLTGWPTASKVHFVTYQIDTNSNPVAGTQLDCYGIVSGSSITNLTVVDGTDAGNAVGDVVEMLPTAAWGQDLSDALLVAHDRTGALNTVAVTKGGTGNTSLTQSGILYGNGASALGVTAAGTSGQVLTSNGASAPTWNTNSSTGYFQLLHAGNGTDTNTSATNVDTVAISGLTALDTLMVKLTIQQATQICTSPLLYSSTDGTIITQINQGTNLPTGSTTNAVFYISQDASTANSYTTIGTTQNLTTSSSSGGAAAVAWMSTINMATAWTGSWTLALRKNGMTAGGTTSYAWSVHKIVGQ